MSTTCSTGFSRWCGLCCALDELFNNPLLGPSGPALLASVGGADVSYVIEEDVSGPEADSPINAAIRSFEAAEANLEKLERLFRELRDMVPEGISFGSDPKYDELCRVYAEVLGALPTIDGWKPTDTPIDLNDLAQWRLDAREIDEISAIVGAEQAVDAPARGLAEYRHRLNKKRRQLVREALADVIGSVDGVIRSLREKHKDVADRTRKVEDPEFQKLQRHVQEIETMLGSSLPRPERWVDLRRHLHFGQGGDLVDILELDWPKVRVGLSAGLYDQNEPVPVGVSDLGVLAAAEPRGTVATRLRWDSLSPEDFERLLFAMISGPEGTRTQSG
jgi:hypothetical protein